MLKLLKFGGIPNVVSHTFGDKVFNLQMYKFGILAFKKRKIQNVESLNQNKQANKYIMKQVERLLIYARGNEWEKFDFLAQKCLTSYAFQVQAYNSVCPLMTTLKISTLKYHIRAIRNIAFKRKTDMDLTRVWIDKKPGDHGRPLGVPSIVWRVHLRQMLNICEIAVAGQSKYSPVQHGGRPGFGVGTCLAELHDRLRKAKYVYEFDIRGFFDNVSKQAMLKLLPEGSIKDRMYHLIRAVPNKYKFYPRNSKKVIQSMMVRMSDMIQSGVQSRFIRYQIQNGYFYSLKLKKFAKISDLSDAQRYFMRDRTFGLGDPDKGVPQGTSFGSFMSSTTVGHHLRNVPNLLMYCDDGLIFLNEGDPDPRPNLEAKLEELGLKLHREKSVLRSAEYLRKFGLKFLGTRSFKHDDGTITMQAETRGGSQKPLDGIMPLLEDYDKFDRPQPSWRGSTEVNLKILEINLRNRGKEFKCLTKNLLREAIKYNFFNFLLSRAYDPNTDETQMRQAIITGLRSALRKVKESRNSLGEFILRTKIFIVRQPFNKTVVIRPNIFNLSTFACNILLSNKDFFIFSRVNSISHYVKKSRLYR